MTMSKTGFKLGLLGAMLSLAGCSGLSIPKDMDMPNKYVLTDDIKQAWGQQTPALRKVGMKDNFVIESPDRIPTEIANKRIEVTFSKDSTLDDLAGVLNTLGFYMVVPEDELRSKKMMIYEFKGKFGDFLNAMSVAHDLSFSWFSGNVLMVQKEKPFILQIPQNDNVAKAIEENIAALGATEVKTSVQAGTISYKASERNQRRIVDMIERMGLNAAVVSMQVAIVNVSLDRERNTGFDWGSLKAGIGAQDLGKSENESGGGVDTVNNAANALGSAAATTGQSSETKLGSNLKDMAAFFGLTKDGVALNLAKGDFSFMSAFRMLSTYGETKTAQSVLMDSLSGEEVTLKSGQKVPYIDSVGVNTASSTANNSNSLGSTEISEVEIGLELKLTPFYDNRSQTVTIGVDLSLSSLLRYVELSAGNQLGSVTRPLTQEQAFTDLVRVKAGESIIIGGLTYDSYTDSRNNLNFLENTDSASQAKKISRTAMFILMRPTVTVFESQGVKP
jgi:hypothetical protein